MKIIATLICYNSKADRAGNRYWAFSYTDHKTGKVVVGRISGGESNINIIRHALNGNKWPSFDDPIINYIRMELPIRQFNTLVEGMPYAGSQPEELAKFILDQINA